MNKIKTLAGAMLLLIALLATSTVWAQTAAPTKPTSKEQYTQMLKDKQAQMAKQRADRAAQPRKAKATTTAATAVKDDPALKAQKEAAQTTTVTRKAKAYVPTEADKKATAEKMAKGGVATKATTNRTVKPYVPTEADKKATDAKKTKEQGNINMGKNASVNKPVLPTSKPATMRVLTKQEQINILKTKIAHNKGMIDVTKMEQELQRLEQEK
jgi:hypothetical protein